MPSARGAAVGLGRLAPTESVQSLPHRHPLAIPGFLPLQGSCVLLHQLQLRWCLHAGVNWWRAPMGWVTAPAIDECSVAGWCARMPRLPSVSLLAGSEFVSTGVTALADCASGRKLLALCDHHGHGAAPATAWAQDVTAERLAVLAWLIPAPSTGHPQRYHSALCDRLTLEGADFRLHLACGRVVASARRRRPVAAQPEHSRAPALRRRWAAGDVVTHRALREQGAARRACTAVRLHTPWWRSAASACSPMPRRTCVRACAWPAFSPGCAAGQHHGGGIALQLQLRRAALPVPGETVLPGTTPAQTLRHHTEEGARQRYPRHALPRAEYRIGTRAGADCRAARYEMYLLTVHRPPLGAAAASILPGRGLGGQPRPSATGS